MQPLLAIAACGSHSLLLPGPDLALVRRLDRASLALRGVHASDADVERVLADPGALREVVSGYTTDERFGENVRDMHAEHLHLRWGIIPHGIAVGPLAAYDDLAVEISLDEAPLRWIEHVVMSGRPYTDLVTSDETMVDAIVATAYGLPYDPAGPTWQVARWQDGRPAAGVLADIGYLQRNMSPPGNDHRGRANALTSAFVCDDFARRPGLALDIVDPVSGGNVVQDDAACAACHASMDPIAAAFAPLRGLILPKEILTATDAGCPPELAYACYPLQFYDPALPGPAELEVPDPAWYGTPVADLAELGRKVAEDPRFASCTAERFWSWFTHAPRDDVPFGVSSVLAESFEEGGYDARALAVDVVTHPAFDEVVSMRPEQYARFVEDLTGYRWTALNEPAGGQVDLARNDSLGLHTILGGGDGFFVLESTVTPTPTGVLARKWLAEEAAASVVDRDAAAPVDERRLLVAADPRATTDEAIDAQLRELQHRILGPATDFSATDALRDLFDAALERHGDPLPAWKLVIAALLLDPEAVAY